MHAVADVDDEHGGRVADVERHAGLGEGGVGLALGLGQQLHERARLDVVERRQGGGLDAGRAVAEEHVQGRGAGPLEHVDVAVHARAVEASRSRGSGSPSPSAASSARSKLADEVSSLRRLLAFGPSTRIGGAGGAVEGEDWPDTDLEDDAGTTRASTSCDRNDVAAAGVGERRRISTAMASSSRPASPTSSSLATPLRAARMPAPSARAVAITRCSGRTNCIAATATTAMRTRSRRPGCRAERVRCSVEVRTTTGGRRRARRRRRRSRDRREGGRRRTGVDAGGLGDAARDDGALGDGVDHLGAVGLRGGDADLGGVGVDLDLAVGADQRDAQAGHERQIARVAHAPGGVEGGEDARAAPGRLEGLLLLGVVDELLLEPRLHVEEVGHRGERQQQQVREQQLGRQGNAWQSEGRPSSCRGARAIVHQRSV